MNVKVAADIGCVSKPKNGEEVCGDRVEIIRTEESVAVIVSDGLGSGIKASILSILTTKIVAELLKRKVPLEHVFETVADTLPKCKVRGLAYATLSILEMKQDGSAHLIEFDTPQALVFRKGEIIDIESHDRLVAGKQVRESFFKLEPEDTVILFSDGVIHSGISGLFKLGLQIDGLKKYLTETGNLGKPARDIAEYIVDLAAACDLMELGDDTTAAVVSVRVPRRVTVVTGPPADPADDPKIVEMLMAEKDGKRVVCGGTTGNLIARETHREVKVQLGYVDPSVPPTAVIAGIDLVTEGIITLNRCSDYVEAFVSGGAGLPESEDGASRLSRILAESDDIKFVVGGAENPAHTDMSQLLRYVSREGIIEKLAKLLQSAGKDVSVVNL